MGDIQPGISQHTTFDAELLLEDGIAARTSSGVGSVATVAKVVDLAPGVLGDGHIARVDFDLQVIVSAAIGNDGNETYVLSLQLSDDAGFGSFVTAETITHPRLTTERYRGRGSNQFGSKNYKYARIAHTLGGTTPSITYTAYLSMAG